MKREERLAILRISNSGGPQSSPFNSFTLMRSHLFSDELTTYFSYEGPFSAIKWKQDFDDLHRTEHADTASVDFVFGDNKKTTCLSVSRRWTKETGHLVGRRLVHAHSPSRAIEAIIIFRIIAPKTPVFTTVHNHALNFSRRQKFKIAMACLLGTRTIFVSYSAYQSFKKIIPRFLHSKTMVIQNGVDIDRARKAGENLTNDVSRVGDCLRLVTIGRHVPQKNREMLFTIIGELGPNGDVSLFGSGGALEKLKSDARAFGVEDSIAIKGNVDRDVLLSELVGYDAFISTSHWEGLPVALMEAMAMGLPCIVSDIPAHREVGNDCEGVFFATSLDDWLEAVEHVRVAGEERRRYWGETNKKHIEDFFSMEKMQREYRNAYEEVLSGL